MLLSEMWQSWWEYSSTVQGHIPRGYFLLLDRGFVCMWFYTFCENTAIKSQGINLILLPSALVILSYSEKQVLWTWCAETFQMSTVRSFCGFVRVNTRKLPFHGTARVPCSQLLKPSEPAPVKSLRRAELIPPPTQPCTTFQEQNKSGREQIY